MKNFKEFDIKPTSAGMLGEKISVTKILNIPIVVVGYEVKDSKYPGKGKCLYMQIEFNKENRVIFVSAKYLIDVLEKISKDNFPFATTIQHLNNRLEFT